MTATMTAQPPSVSFGLPARIVRVVDGDTLLCEATLQEYVRLDGIDTPEKRVPEQAAAAEVVRRAVIWWFGRQSRVSITPVAYGKFGQRLRCTVSGDGGGLDTWLLSRRLARPYHGERKTAWTEGELSVILAQANDFPAEQG